MLFSQKVLRWYATNKRPLPWRATKDPYKIWLSEIILQQTRVAQGTPYYLKFIAHFPSVEDLAKAPEEEVMKLWQGLGYYSRARNLHATAKLVTQQYQGAFPNSYNELIKLKGVGDYTASAIASICFDAPHAVVDGNVYRVLSRYFGITLPINDAQGSTYFKQLAQELMDEENIRDYNQAIMEFGAIQCVPKSPNCPKCPLNDGCVAVQKGLVESLPLKLKKSKPKNRYFNYVVPLARDAEGYPSTVIEKRREKGIWKHLWQFPLIESDMEIDLNCLKNRIPEQLRFIDATEVYLHNEKPLVHKLTHQHLHTKFWIARCAELKGHTVLVSELEVYPMPVLLADFIKTFKI
ncbi:MAG: A/G-specific adenine glycosylase [Flavobacteriaceae bacterium]